MSKKRKKIKSEKPPYGLTPRAWRDIQKAALLIDPETCVYSVWTCWYGAPYGDFPEHPDESKTTVKYLMAREPNSDIWVCDNDLPKETLERLDRRIEKECRSSKRSRKVQKCAEKFYEID